MNRSRMHRLHSGTRLWIGNRRNRKRETQSIYVYKMYNDLISAHDPTKKCLISKYVSIAVYIK